MEKMVTLDLSQSTIKQTADGRYYMTFVASDDLECIEVLGLECDGHTALHRIQLEQSPISTPFVEPTATSTTKQGLSNEFRQLKIGFESEKEKTSTTFEMFENLINQSVKVGDVESLLRQNGDNIMLAIREKGTDLKTAINLSRDDVRIKGNNLYLDADTYISKGIIQAAHIGSVNADTITAGTINAARVNIINLDAMNITSRRAEFIQAGFTALNSRLTADGTRLRIDNRYGGYIEMNNIPEVRSEHQDGTAVVLGNGRTYFIDRRGFSKGYVGVDMHGGTNDMGIFMSRGGGTFRIAAATGVPMNKLLELNNANVTTVLHPGQQVLIKEEVVTSGDTVYENFMRFGVSSGGQQRVYVDKYAYFGAGSNLSSDRRLKRDIQDTKVNALETIQSLTFKEYVMTSDNRFYPVGLIAQEAGLLQTYDEEEDRYGIDLMTAIMLALKGVQELNTKLEG